MKTRLLIATLISMAFAIKANAIDMPQTQLNYKVQYRWGIIDVAIGQGIATISIDNDNLQGTLAGESIPWEGRVFSIGDTLTAVMSPTVQQNQFITGWYRKPKTGQNVDIDNPAHYRTIQGQGSLNASPETMEAVTITANMIGLFYYAKSIDFATMNPGEIVEIDITNQDGSPEKLQITYNGNGQSTSGANQEVYDITFNYTYQGEYTNYPVKCEISTAEKLPVYFGADLKIGHVDMYLAQQ